MTGNDFSSVITTFNFYYDIKFWLAFVSIFIIYRLLAFNHIGRIIFLFIGSVFMILALPKFNLVSFGFLFAVCVLIFLIGYFLNGNVFVKDRSKRMVVSVAGIMLVVLILSFFKYSWFREVAFKYLIPKKVEATDYIFIIGISYSSFKMIHFLIESYKQQIKELRFVSFVSYIFFFPAFISGPINRYNQFSEGLDLKNTSNVKDDLKIGVERIIHGLFKKFVLSTIVFPYAIVNIQKSILELNPHEILIGCYAYTFYFYFDFSGYSDLAIGCGKIMGIELPENFNNPFLKANIQQLWANWHMSLTRWLTDYIYWPLSKKLRKGEYLSKHPILLSNISIIITFIICGMWHGESLNFVIWGLYHGVGLAILNIYQKCKRKVRNKVIKGYFLSRYSQWIGTICTFNFFALGILLFSFDISKIKILISRIL